MCPLVGTLAPLSLSLLRISFLGESEVLEVRVDDGSHAFRVIDQEGLVISVHQDHLDGSLTDLPHVRERRGELEQRPTGVQGLALTLFSP